MFQQDSVPENQIITQALIKQIRDQFQINWNGIHGVSHWARVFDIGMRLAHMNGASKRVVQLFSVFHDSGRHNEGIDPQHGPRGANLASKLRTKHLKFLSDEEFHQLYSACQLHTHSATHEDITVQTCFDSDRLDLGRVGTIPDPHYLCTEAAKSEQMILWALENSERGSVPDNILGNCILEH